MKFLFSQRKSTRESFRNVIIFQARADTAATDAMETDEIIGCNEEHVQCNGTGGNPFGKATPIS